VSEFYVRYKMLAQSLVLFLCFALFGCSREDSTTQSSAQHMSKAIDFGISDYQRTVPKLKPHINYGPDGESQDEPWTDVPKFRAWLEALQLGEENIEALLEVVPSVSLSINHGLLFGVERFIEDNSDSDHNVLEAGFLIFATGPNGDFIVVDTRNGNGQTGWLPMAKIWDMDTNKVREHFVPTNPNLGDFLRASEEEWSSVPKDWYDARDHAAK